MGTRRRNYMILGATMAAAGWLLMGSVSANYQLLLGAAVVMNCFTVLSSTVMGGLMVEAGQLYGAPGRISSLRQVVQSASQILGPMAGGWLAGMAYGWMTGVAAFTMLLLAATTFFVHKEKPVEARAPLTAEERARPRYKPPVQVLVGLTALAAIAGYLATTADLRNVGFSLLALESVLLIILGLAVAPTQNPVIVRAQGQLTQIFGSTTLWLAVFMLFLVYTVPGLNTALYYQQTEVHKFDNAFIGQMGSLEGAVGIVAALGYGFACRRFSLRQLLVGGVSLSAITTYGYMFYAHDTAPFIHGSTAFCGVLAELALMDLAVRSTPRGCEALGFSLMMATRNFGIAMSDVIGTEIMEKFEVSFRNMVIVNGTTSLAVLAFVLLLPPAIMNRKEGEAAAA
jgi:predicted MFS family arabinose efflux permease